MGYETQPTPTSTKCPRCENGTLMLGIDVTHYYQVVKITEELVAAQATGETGEHYEDLRLFCDHCGTYFEVPANKKLTPPVSQLHE